MATLRDGGYETPTAIQAEVIPPLTDGRDVSAQSETGSGKTAAFALPMLTRLSAAGKGSTRGGRPRALVLAPTRELAIQVVRAVRKYGGEDGPRSVAIVGGQDYDPQLRALQRGVEIVVGTPGRIIDHLNRGSLDPGGVEMVVLDEADEMLKMGFADDVAQILEGTPATRQTALFSATFPPAIRDIADRYMNDPVRVTVRGESMTADSIEQRAVIVPPRMRCEVLSRILQVEPTDGVIVFTKTKDATIAVASDLAGRGFKTVPLNGDMPQNVRTRAVADLSRGTVDVLVATDVAARGLDVPRVSHVINYDLPHDGESYVHRVGRTGRAGRGGVAYLMITGGQRRRLRDIERLTGGRIEIVDPPQAGEVNDARVESFFDSIRRTLAAEDVSEYTEVVRRYVAESGQSIELVAAALARLSRDDEPLFVKELPPPPKRREREDRGGGGPRPRGGRPVRGGGDRVRYSVAVGRQDGLRPGNLVGAIANEANLSGDQIGPIKIQDRFTTVDLPAGLDEALIDRLKGVRVMGKPMKIRRWETRGPKKRFKGKPKR